MENLFNCLCSLLLEKENRDRFLQGEGIQLMNLMLRLEIQIILPDFGSGSVGSVYFGLGASQIDQHPDPYQNVTDPQHRILPCLLKYIRCSNKSVEWNFRMVANF